MMMNEYAVGVVSLGCSKNRVDTERMLGLLRATGRYRFVNDPKEAEVLIINTCGFIEPAKQESINTILEMAQYKKTGRCRVLAATGCLSERYRAQLAPELPEVDVFLGVREYEKLPGLIASALGEAQPALSPCGAPRVLTTPPYCAYLRIGDGCNNRCAYCAIPLIRGPLKSVPMPVLMEEAAALVEGGVTELTLIAQDTSGYGVDLYGKPMLLPLMEALTRLSGLHWLRVLYTYPDTVTQALIEGMAGNPKICNYLDIPLQHIHGDMLLSMHRRGTPAHMKRVLSYIRANAPDFMLRTTMMVGFPGETEEMFQTLLDFLKEYPFDRVGAFAFSPEEGTPAASMPHQVPEEIKNARLHNLMHAQTAISQSRNQRRVGSITEALIIGNEGDRLIGRSYGEAPEVDGHILVRGAAPHTAGDYIRVRLTGCGEYDMMGEELL